MTCTRWTANSATIFTQEYSWACLYTFGGLININASVGNTWKNQGKASELDEDWRVITLSLAGNVQLYVILTLTLTLNNFKIFKKITM